MLNHFPKAAAKKQIGSKEKAQHKAANSMFDTKEITRRVDSQPLQLCFAE